MKNLEERGESKISPEVIKINAWMIKEAVGREKDRQRGPRIEKEIKTGKEKGKERRETGRGKEKEKEKRRGREKMKDRIDEKERNLTKREINQIAEIDKLQQFPIKLSLLPLKEKIKDLSREFQIKE